MKTGTGGVQLERSIRLDLRVQPSEFGIVFADEHVVGLKVRGR